MAEEETIVSVRDNPFFKNDGRRLFRRQPVGGAGAAREKTLGLPSSVSHPPPPAHHAIHSYHSLERANKVVHSATHQSSLSLSPIRVTSGSQHEAPVRVPAGSRREAPPATRMETVHSTMRSDGEEDERSEETVSVGSGSDLEYGPGIVERLKAKFASLGGKRGEKKQRSPSMSDLAEERNYSTLDRHASAARQQIEHSTQSLTRRHSRSQGDLRGTESRPFTIHRELLSPTAGDEETDMDSLKRRFEAAGGAGGEVVKMRRRSPSSDRSLHRLSLLPNDASPPRQLRLAVKSMDMDTPTQATPTSILKKDRDEVKEYRPQPSSVNDDRFVDIAGSGELKVYPVRRSIALEQQRREREEKPGKILDVLNQSSDDSVSLFDSSIRSTMSAGGDVHVPGGGAAGSEPEFVRQLRRLRRSSECEGAEEATRVPLRRRALDLPSLSDRARVVRGGDEHKDRARSMERAVSPSSTPSLPATPAPVDEKRQEERREREAVQRVQTEARQRPEQLFASPPDPHSARERHSPPLLSRESIASDASPPPEEPKPSRDKRDKALEPAAAAPAVSAAAAPFVVNRVEAAPSVFPALPSSRLEVPKLRPTRIISPQPPVVPTNDASGMTEMQKLLSRFNKTKTEKYGTEDAPKQDHEVTGRVVEIEKASIPQLQLHHVALYREVETPSVPAQAPSVPMQAPAQAPAPAPSAAPHPEEPPRDYSRDSSRRSSVASVCEYDVNPDEEVTPSMVSQLPSSLSALSSRPSIDAPSPFAPSVVSVRSETAPSSSLAAPRPNVVSISVSAQGNTPSVIYTNHTRYDEPSIRSEIPKRPAPPPPAFEEPTPVIDTPPPPPPHGRQEAKTVESPRKSLTAMFLEQQKAEEKPYGDDATEMRDNAAEEKEVEEQKVVTTVVEMNADVVEEEEVQKAEEVVDVRYVDDECIYDVVASSEVGVELDSEPEVIEEENVAEVEEEKEEIPEIPEVAEEEKEQTVEEQPETVNAEPTTSQDKPEEKKQREEEKEQEEATPLEAPPTAAAVEEEYKSIFDDSDEDSDVATSDEEETLLRPSLHGMSSGLLAGDGNPVAVRHSLISLVAEEDLPALMEAMSETYHPVFEDVDDQQMPSTSSIIHPPAERRERRMRRQVSSIRFGTSLPTVYTYLDEPSACQETEWRDGVHVEYEVYEKMVAAEDEEYQRKQVELEQWRAQMAAQAAANRLQQQQPEQLKDSEFSMGVTQKFTYDAGNSISVP